MDFHFISYYSARLIFILLAVSFSLSVFKKRKASTAVILISIISFIVFFGSRAILKIFFPFTSKLESFYTLSFCLLFCILIYRKKLNDLSHTIIIFLSCAFTTVVFIFNDVIMYPPPFLNTIWYPAHVPLSFAAYAAWFCAAAVSAASLKTNAANQQDDELISHLNRRAFVFFNIAMIFGGIWGYFCWGAYFMWDPKLLWSVILWIYYGNLLHLDLIPRFYKWKRPLFLLGVILILITFIGTGFFSRSIHRF